MNSRDRPKRGVVPPPPESLEDTGISLSLIEQLILKFLYFRGEVMGRDLASLLGLQYSLIDELLETLKRQHHVGIKKSLGMGNSSGIFALTESGRNLTREYLENNQYAGTVPVPLHQYAEVVRRQRLAEDWLTPDSLKRRLQTSGGGAGHPGAHRAGGELQQVVPDLRPARQRQDRAGRIAVSRGDGADLHALRDRVPGQHHPALRPDLSPEDRRFGKRQRHPRSGSRVRSPLVQVPPPVHHHRRRAGHGHAGSELQQGLESVRCAFPAQGQQRHLSHRRLWTPEGLACRDPEPLDRSHGAARRLSELPGRRQDDGAVRGVPDFLHQPAARPVGRRSFPAPHSVQDVPAQPRKEPSSSRFSSASPNRGCWLTIQA